MRTLKILSLFFLLLACFVTSFDAKPQLNKGALYTSNESIKATLPFLGYVMSNKDAYYKCVVTHNISCRSKENLIEHSIDSYDINTYREVQTLHSIIMEYEK
ncbi:hypothetical protein [Peribacillus loiseleuriae]|uniref:Uncharacterized protein n=1 Tax=Peribacillus loiseleuriae TaxID=1679170 RepID=A0A0K9GUL7_9BACI|nr:hypothetical protein [Peribacillus loiseleuriae]KMY50379.1 hypothetical protein AC625_13435 [Peribacillus loiseleuriae]